MTESSQHETMFGFEDPVRQSQSTFRCVMTAMSRPGLVTQLPPLPSAPNGLQPALAAIALTLADYETPMWLDLALAEAAGVREYLSFQTGAQIVQAPAAAAFALISDVSLLPSLNSFALGTQEYPDRSTTLVLAVESLNGCAPLCFAGPGIDGTITIAPGPMPLDFRAQWNANREFFPCGVDLLLCAGRAVVGLPRSIDIVED